MAQDNCIVSLGTNAELIELKRGRRDEVSGTLSGIIVGAAHIVIYIWPL